MADPFLGEIRPFAFGFAPRGWARCEGQLLPINQNQALFALLGTMYGGNGTTTFALPDLRGRVPMHFSPTQVQGARFGTEAHALNLLELPAHTHQPLAAPGAAEVNRASLSNAAPASATKEVYATQLQSVGTMPAISAVGGNQAHENRMPSLVINFSIALQGIFPSQN